MQRISYHQSVFDLLDLQPSESATAREMIEVCEAHCGWRLPEAVRQWYLIDQVVPLQRVDNFHGFPENEENHLWYDYSNMDHPEPLDMVLQRFASELQAYRPGSDTNRVRILVENQAVCSWFVQLDGSDDPPVVVDESYDYRPNHPDGSRVLEWVKVADYFSEFVFDWVADYYFREWTPLSERDVYPGRRTRPACEKPHFNGLWLYAPCAEGLDGPSLDFLLEHFDEDRRMPVSEGVIQYQFRNKYGRLRVTSDGLSERDGISSWWLHADSEEDLFQLVRPILWLGN